MNQNLKVALTLTADGSDLVGTVKLSRDEIEQLGDATEQAGDAATQTGRRLDRMGRDADGAGESARGLWQQMSSLKGVAAGLGVTLGGLGLGSAASGLLDVARETENLETRLRILLGSTAEGNRLFQDMTAFAGSVPFEFAEIMSASTQLAGVMRGGRDEINQWMPLIADVAAASGLGIQQTTEQITRMYSAGAASADLFRERGTLAMLGFQAGVSYSAAETREILMATWNDVDSQFRGAAEGLAETWDGTTSMLQDAWRQFKQDVSDAGVFAAAKAELQSFEEDIQALRDDNVLAEWAEATGEAILTTAHALQTLGEIAAVSGAVYIGVTALSIAMGGLVTSAVATRVAMAAGIPWTVAYGVSMGAAAQATRANLAAVGALKASLGLLFAAFAGFKVGEFLKEEFVEARVAGLAFVGAMMEGWEQLKFGGRAFMAAIDTAWDTVIATMKATFADFLDGIGNGLANVPFMSEQSASVRAFAASLRGAAEGVVPLTVRLAELAATRDAEIAGIRTNITELVGYELAADAAARATGDLADESDDAAASLREQSTAIADYITGLEERIAFEQLAGREQAILTALREADTVAANAQVEITETQRDEIRRLAGALFDLGQASEETRRITEQAVEVADPFAAAWEGAIKRVDRLFVDLWASLGRGTDDFLDGLKTTLTRTFAEIANAQITRPLLASLGLGGALGVPGTAAASSPLDGLTGLFGGGGGISSGIGEGLATLASFLGDTPGGAGFGLGDVATQFAQQGFAAGLGESFSQLGSVFSGGGVSGLAGGLPAIGASLLAAQLVDSLSGGKLFGTSFAAVDAGVNLDIGNGRVGGTSFVREERERSLGRGTASRTLVEALDPQLAAVLTEQFDVVTDGLAVMSRQLGVSAEGIDGFTASLAINTFGLSPEQAQARVQTEFGRVLEGLTGTVLDGVAGFRRAGEDFQDTFERLVDTVDLLTTSRREIESTIRVLADGADAQAEALRLSAAAINDDLARLAVTDDLQARVQLEASLAGQIQARYQQELAMLTAVQDAVGAALADARSLRAAVAGDIASLNGAGRLRTPQEIRADLPGNLPGLPNVEALLAARADERALSGEVGRLQALEGAALVQRTAVDNLSTAVNEVLAELSINGARLRVAADAQTGEVGGINPADLFDLPFFGIGREADSRLQGAFGDSLGLAELAEVLQSGAFADVLNSTPNFSLSNLSRELYAELGAALGALAPEVDELVALLANADLGQLASVLTEYEQAQQLVADLQADFTQGIADFVGPASEAVRTLSGLRDETLAYLDAQRRLMDGYRDAAASIAATRQEIVRSAFTPAATLEALQADFNALALRATSADGAELLDVAGQLNQLAPELVALQREVFASGGSTAGVITGIDTTLAGVQLRLEELGLGTSPEIAAVALLGDIDSVLQEIELGLEAADRAVDDAIRAGTEQTVTLLTQIRDLMAAEQGVLVGAPAAPAAPPNADRTSQAQKAAIDPVTEQVRRVAAALEAAGPITLEIVAPDGELIQRQTIDRLGRESRTRVVIDDRGVGRIA